MKLPVRSPISKTTVPKSVNAMNDKAARSNGTVLPGVSIRHGPVQQIDVSMPDANAVDANGISATKRKSRESIVRPSYAEAESSEDDKPLVCANVHHLLKCRILVGFSG